MLQRVLGLIREAKDAPRIEDPAVVETQYREKRNQVLLASMVGYGLFYFCRGNLSSALPLLQTDLRIEKDDIGKIGSALFATYGICKFLTGLVADRASPKTLMVAGLVLSAILNIAFGLSSDLLFLCFLWGANGVVQSFGAPASAKVIAVWFSASERGAKTGIWNISHQAGGGIVLIFAGFCAQLLGWRGAMIVPALFSLAAVLFIMPFLHDRPESHGLPPVEEWSATKTEVDDAGESFLAMFLRRVLLNPRVWLIALASLCTYFVRYGALYYAPKYLKEVRGMPIWLAGSSSSLLEFLGIPGAFLCGWLSDRLGARRAPVVFASLLLLAASTWALVRVPAGMFAVDLLLLAAIGFFTYGPQMLLAGVAPVDMSSKRVAAAAVGFTGLMSYAGASASTHFAAQLIKTDGWTPAFDMWAKAAVTGAVLCIPLWYASPVRRAEVAPPRGP